MSCNIDKFVLTKGLDNDFVLTIKQTGTTLPMEIDEVNDTFAAKLINLETEATVLTTEIVITVSDALGGKINLQFTQADIDALDAERGEKVDRYYLKPTYKLLLDCSTTNNGDFIAKIPLVYVE